jgi:hypothetical protein
MPQVDAGVVVPIIRSRENRTWPFWGQGNSTGAFSEFRIACSLHFIRAVERQN